MMLPTLGEEKREWFVVGVYKIPEVERDRAQNLLAQGEFYDCIGADTRDEDDQHPVGTPCTYGALLTRAQAAELAEHGESSGEGNNVRYVEPDSIGQADTAPAAAGIPATSSLRWMRADPDILGSPAWHGRDQTVAVLDSGTTDAVRQRMGWTLVGRGVFGDDPGASEVWPGQVHGCQVASCGVPAGGRLLDALITPQSSDGSVSAYASAVIAALRWAVDQGARIIVLSYSGFTAGSVWTDALDYVRAAGAQLFASAGNRNVASIDVPASYAPTYPDTVHSSIAFDEITNARATFSSYAADGSGCAPGVGIVTLNAAAETGTVQGTSYSAPLTAMACAMGSTGGRFTPRQVGGALKVNSRDTGQRQLEQGAGAVDLRRALVALGAIAAPGPRRNPSLRPSAESDVTSTYYGVSGSSAPSVPAPVTSGGRVGAQWASSTASAAGSLQLYGPGFSCTSGQVYAPSVFWRRSRADGVGARIYVQWYAGTTYLGYSSANPTIIPNPGADIWHRLSHVAVLAPDGATSGRPSVYIGDAIANEVLGVDGWLLEPTSVGVEPYFDGATAGAVWEGRPHASPSTLLSTSAPPRPGAMLLGA